MGLILCPYGVHPYVYLSLDKYERIVYTVKDMFEKDNVADYNIFEVFDKYRDALALQCENMNNKGSTKFDYALNTYDYYEQILRLWMSAMCDRITEVRGYCVSFVDIRDTNSILANYRLAMIEVHDERLAPFYEYLYEEMSYWERVILDRLYALKYELSEVAK